MAAGTYGRALLAGEAGAEGGGAFGISPWQLALGLGASGLAIWYVGRLAKSALDEVEETLDADD